MFPRVVPSGNFIFFRALHEGTLVLYNYEMFNFFNSKTIEKLSKSAGLALNLVENIQRFPISNHLHWLSKGLPSGHLEWSFLDSSDLSLAYEESLVSIGATDNVIASFKKFEK